MVPPNSAPSPRFQGSEGPTWKTSTDAVEQRPTSQTAYSNGLIVTCGQGLSIGYHLPVDSCWVTRQAREGAFQLQTTMSSIFPTQATLQDVFCRSASWRKPVVGDSEPPRSQYLARAELYSTWSAVDDAKVKAQHLGDVAVKEFDKASKKAQAAAGGIEPYTMKYYAACTFGGLLACVRSRLTSCLAQGLSVFRVSLIPL